MTYRTRYTLRRLYARLVPVFQIALMIAAELAMLFALFLL